MIRSTDHIWQIKANTKGRSDFDFFESDNKKYGIYYSNIDEYGMMKFVSPVQIWTDKENPRLLFQSTHIKFEYQNSQSCYYLELSDIVVLLIPRFCKDQFELFYILFDLKVKSFAILNCVNFDLTEISKSEIRLDLNFRYSYDQNFQDQIAKDNGKLLILESLDWNSLNELGSFLKV